MIRGQTAEMYDLNEGMVLSLGPARLTNLRDGVGSAATPPSPFELRAHHCTQRSALEPSTGGGRCRRNPEDCSSGSATQGGRGLGAVCLAALRAQCIFRSNGPKGSISKSSNGSTRVPFILLL